MHARNTSGNLDIIEKSNVSSLHLPHQTMRLKFSLLLPYAPKFFTGNKIQGMNVMKICYKSVTACPRVGIH